MIMTLDEAKKLKIPYYNYVCNYAASTCGDILTMNYLNCFELIKQKHADADFQDFYDTYMLICYNNY